MAKIWVKGYTKPDGTKVKGHFREVERRYFDKKVQSQFVSRIKQGQTPYEAESALDIQFYRRKYAGKKLSVTQIKKAYGARAKRGMFWPENLGI